MINIIKITDYDGNTYTKAVPNRDGEAYYSVLPDGRITVVAILSKDAQNPKFVLAPAEPTAAEKALRAELEDARESINRFWEESWGEDL